MIGYLILLAFWVLATLTLFALSVPNVRKRETKLVIALLVAVIAVGVYTMYMEGLERTWWAISLLVLGVIGGAALSVFIEQRDVVQQEVPQRMVK
ncbi:hypothetical protein [Exiguobacterium alkaliphilum]|uniref:Uncharacterized protein n=1 Tax=Exiguobacterium alkaliphilum TaxID=1428684 RepID=A0ABT2L1D5_9BACL|nr:hypothetical protein [Exiguobacterium alkaliphilum]MCT4795730.1 hypothetical protein [Exiguobacterium alkaliphilum]QUE85895.1 hypothetical protein KB235_12155 [Exiguobacterium alkaliphilum]